MVELEFQGILAVAVAGRGSRSWRLEFRPREECPEFCEPRRCDVDGLADRDPIADHIALPALVLGGNAVVVDDIVSQVSKVAEQREPERVCLAAVCPSEPRAELMLPGR